MMKPLDHGSLILGALALARELRCPAEAIDWESLREAYPAGYEAFLGEERQKAENVAALADAQAKAESKQAFEQAEREAFLRKVDACSVKPATKLRVRIMARKFLYTKEFLAYPEDGVIKPNNQLCGPGSIGAYRDCRRFELQSWREELHSGSWAQQASTHVDLRKLFKFHLLGWNNDFPMPEREPDVYYLDKMELDGEILLLAAERGFITPEAEKLWRAVQQPRDTVSPFEVEPTLIKTAISTLESNPCYTITSKERLRPLVDRYNKLFPSAKASSIEEVLHKLKADTTI